ncbi:MAG: hypothetical protein HZA93_23770 [Verrucomicrobia bacterium]|nr:hypothetical protein [Verrucomicrobiota bacterium]
MQTSCAGGAARVDRRCGPHTPPERVAAYEAVLAEWSTGRESLAIVCARHAIKPSSLNGWRAKYRPARAPVPKPSGRLL